MELNEVTHQVIGAAIEVHRELGPGLLESVYEECLSWELARRGLEVGRQCPISIRYKERQLDQTLRLDMVVDNQVVLELKSVDKLAPLHNAQLLTYLKLAEIRAGLLINFNVEVLRHGVRRLLNG
jgi:GxxExxY protein